MGISGLLPLLKSIHKSCNLRKFEGKTIGVDAYGWLHRGTVACAMELAMGKPTRKFVDFAMHRVRMLQHFGVTPYIIFDGDYLPSKAATEADRHRRRLNSKKLGMELLNAGKTSQAYLEFQKAADVTPEMARQLIDELNKVGVQYIVAPYEADAQMVYLERKGIIDGILSEDSDLLVFGAKCLLTKLDQYGNCIEINKADFCACKEITLTGWSETEFRQMAILSGCDYLASINNMGLKTAYRMVRKHKTIEKVIRMLQFDGKFHVPKGYVESFRQAEFTFLHQRVFCPISSRIVFHTEPDQQLDANQMAYIGAYVEPEIAQGVARGDLNPMTKMPITPPSRGSSASPSVSSKARGRVSIASDDHDLKKGQPITTFFKKRIPLGELDINCFTPSPSQENTLRRNSGPWQASLARPYVTRTASEPVPQPQSAPAAVRTSGRTLRTPTISDPRPPKRARLCDEEQLPASASMEMGRSRFFGSGAADPSPSVGKLSRKRRGNKDDITIFSDDSVEEALLSLPDFDGFGSQGSKSSNHIAIFKEVEATTVGSPASYPSAAAATELPTSQVTDPGMTQSMSVASSFDQPATPIEAAAVPSTAEMLKSKFSFGGTSTPTPKPSIGVYGPNQVSVAAAHLTPASSPRPSRIPLAIKKPTAPAPKSQSTLFNKPRQTPLQRLGASAANRANLPMTPPLTPVYAAKPKPRRSMLSKESVPFPEVRAAAIPLPVPDEAESMVLKEQKGSEDLIVRDSEADDDEDEDEDECLSPALKAIDFEQFAFTGF